MVLITLHCSEMSKHFIPHITLFENFKIFLGESRHCDMGTWPLPTAEDLPCKKDGRHSIQPSVDVAPKLGDEI